MKLHPLARTGNRLRRLLYNMSLTSIARTGWRHRGSVVRVTDLVRRAPSRIRQGRAAEALTEVRAIVALDRVLRSDTSVRLAAITEGTALIKGQPQGRALDRARAALLSLDSVSDVRTIDPTQPTVTSSTLSQPSS